MSYTWGYLKDASLAKLDLDEEEATVQNLLSRFPFYANEVVTQVCSAVKPKYAFAEFQITKNDIGVPKEFPDDFVNFGDDVNYELITERRFIDDELIIKKELHDNDFEYHTHNTVIFKHPGHFFVSYNARWYTFDKNISNDEVLKIPTDILECIPSYIASQCYKIDDEYKSSVFRNEYEMMLARIDTTDFRNTKTIEIDGGW